MKLVGITSDVLKHTSMFLHNFII